MTERTQNIVYAPLKWALHLQAYLPWWMLYIQADIMFFIAFYIIRYRRKIVRKNLKESFPEKSDLEIYGIEYKFYRHFADYFFETIKLLHISDEEMHKRMVFKNIELVDEAFAQGRSTMMYAAHYGNWEWTTSITQWGRFKPGEVIYAQVYRPLKNKWFDKFFLNLRSRYHSVSYRKNSVYRDMLMDLRGGKPMVIGFIADQHPNKNDQGHVIEFLNHPTAMITGAEAIARKLDMRVCYFDVRKVKRGHFVCTIKLICDKPEEMPKGAITDRYAQLLEQRIKEEPCYWLWTHNRWKNKVELHSKDEEK